MNERVFSFQARLGTLAMIANMKSGGQMAADPVRSNTTMDNDRIVPKARSEDQSNPGELKIKGTESHSATPSRNPYLTPSPSGALLGVAAEEEGRSTASADDQKNKRNKKVSAQHDASNTLLEDTKRST